MKRGKISDLNHLNTQLVVVKESSFLKGQLGVMAKRNLKKGDRLLSVKGPILSSPTIYSFSVASNKHIDPVRDGQLDFGHYMNHSCDPNTFVRIVENKSDLPYIDIVARRNIKIGDELTLDFASFEYETVSHVKCKCNSKKCRGLIHGFKDLPDSVMKKYKKEGMLSDYLIKLKSGRPRLKATARVIPDQARNKRRQQVPKLHQSIAK